MIARIQTQIRTEERNHEMNRKKFPEAIMKFQGEIQNAYSKYEHFAIEIAAQKVIPYFYLQLNCLFNSHLSEPVR